MDSGGFTAYINSKRGELAILAAIMAVAGALFHIIFPVPFVFPDTGMYVSAAVEGAFNIYRPMGYSHYLGFLHSIVPDFGFVYAVTYSLNAIATLFLLYTARYLLNIESKLLFYALFAFAILSPRVLFASNFLMSDGLFNTLTMFFLATGMWMCRSRSLLVAAAHITIFAMLYSVRFSGMFYIPLTIFALWVSPLRFFKGKWGKVPVYAIPVVIFALLYSGAKKEYGERTGVETISSFSGWQLANNASVLVPSAREMGEKEFRSREAALLNEFAGTFPDSIYTTKNVLSTSLMWNNDLPYKQFLFHYLRTTGKPYPLGWVECGRIYGEYGAALIKKYPFEYFKSYIIPSFAGIFSCKPITEEGNDFVNEPMYRDNWGVEGERYVHRKGLFSALNPARVVINYILWVALAAAMVCFVSGYKKMRGEAGYKTAAFLAIFIIVYIAASAVAAPNTTWRYTLPVFLPSLVFIAFGITIAKGLFAKK